MNSVKPKDGAEIRAVENKFFSAFERGDSAAIAECYGPEMRAWNNVHMLEATGEEHIARLESEFFPYVVDRKYTEVRSYLTELGFARQHVFTALSNGKQLSMPMCIIGMVQNGKLTRLDEYFNIASPSAPSLPEV